MSTKMAILVGLCQVSPEAYGGWNGANGCEGCELDVQHMAEILTPLGYELQTIKTTVATKTAVLSSLEHAAATLTAGDRLVFYFAGHGGQQPDANQDETDGRDETLLAYDGEITDDELNDIWPRFQPEVRIVMLSDSCNSGSNYRAIRDVFTPTPIQPLSRTTRAVMQAQFIHMGGCRDGFTSSGYPTGGAFTTALATVWHGGAFAGNYKAFYEAIVAAVTSGQIPQYNEYGPVSDSFRNEKPFVASASDSEEVPVLPPPPRVEGGLAAESGLSEENQKLLIEAYLKLLATLTIVPPPRTRAVGACHLVYVHGISTHVSGYSDGWWNALKTYTTHFGDCKLGDTRHEVLWSNLVNSRAVVETSAAETQEAALLKARLTDVMADRQRQQASPSGRSAAARAEATRGLDSSRDRGFSLDDFIVYMTNAAMRQQIIDRFTGVVRPLLAAGAEINIICHSWGTVVTYEGLRELETLGLPGRVANLFTVAAALSLPPVRGSLRATNRDGRRPAMVDRWVNLDAQGDLVGGTLADMFDVDVEKLELEPTGCQRNLGGLGWYNLACAHASYFRSDNVTVNRQIFAQFINT